MTENSPSDVTFPFQNLPMDVIPDIFEAACEHYRDSVRSAIKVTGMPFSSSPFQMRHFRKDLALVTPVILSQVCQYWKDIAYSTPVLWDTISIRTTRLDGMDDESSESQVIGVKQWLARSREALLTVNVGYEIGYWSKQGALWGCLADHIVHCKVLRLCCPAKWRDEINFMGLWEALKRPLPLLEVFIIYPWTTLTSPSPEEWPITSSSAPNLSLAALDRSKSTPIRLSGIKELRCSEVDYEIIINCLREMKQLEICYIDQPNRSRDIILPLPSTLISLPTVTEFVLRDTSVGAQTVYRHTLQFVSLPSIRNLVLQISGNEIKYVTALIRNSGFPSTLKSLYISVEEILFYSDLWGLLSSVPNLEHFGLHIRTGFKYSSPREPQPLPALPRLNHLISLKIIPSEAIKFFKHIPMPLLQELHALSGSVPSKDPDLSIIGGLSSSLRILKICTLEGSHFDIELLRVLRKLNQLERLHILAECAQWSQRKDLMDGKYPKWKISSGLIDALRPPSENDLATTDISVIFLPKLAELSLDGVWDARVEALIEALEYRWNGDAARNVQLLKSCRIFAHGCRKLLKYHDTLSDRMEALALQGMDVVFSDYKTSERSY